jgi:hypothetical protein
MGGKGTGRNKGKNVFLPHGLLYPRFILGRAP